MTSPRSNSRASHRQRLMGSAASLANGPSPADWDPTETPSSTVSLKDCSMSIYSMGRLWSVDAAVKASSNELPRGSPTGRANPTSRFGYSMHRDPTVDFKIGSELLSSLSETSTIPALDFFDIELLILFHLYGSFWKDALLEATRGSSPEVREDYIRRANRLYGSRVCSR